jgi:nucleotide-binding universal stress UspA family protein
MKILVAYDGSISADAAIEDLRRAGLPQQAEALVVSVEDGAHPSEAKTDAESGSWRSSPSIDEKFAEKAGWQIQSYFPQWKVSCEALRGSPAKVILETCERWHPDLIVAGSHGHSRTARFFLGSVTLELIHKAPCSVRVARRRGPSANGGPLRIIVGCDGSTEGRAAVCAVASRSWPAKTKAQIISVVETLVPAVAIMEASTFAQEPAYKVIRDVDEQERTWHRKAAEESEEILRRAGLAATSTVMDGDPREVIVVAADLSKADAIFVGARGLGRVERFLLGSVSTHILTHSHCTVEVVRTENTGL